MAVVKDLTPPRPVNFLETVTSPAAAMAAAVVKAMGVRTVLGIRVLPSGFVIAMGGEQGSAAVWVRRRARVLGRYDPAWLRTPQRYWKRVFSSRVLATSISSHEVADVERR